jgi:DNA polymerase-3 subunit delta'
MSFQDILGHRRPISILQRAIERGRVPSTYLFVGPEGIGKKLVALNLAKALNCDGGAGSECCDSCIPCRKVDKGIHPDVNLIEPEGTSLKIEQAREAQRDLSLKPYEGRKKLYIFDQAERMSEACENALLKTLEEPTPDALLILITSSPYSLLPTILSRTQRVRFNALSTEEVASYLVKARSWGSEMSHYVASLSGGSLGRALAKDPGELFRLRGEVLRDHSAALQGGTTVILDLAEAWAKDKDRLSERMECLTIWVRDLKAYQSTQREGLLVNFDLVDRVREEAILFPPGALGQFFEIIQETTRGLARYANARLSLENMWIRMRRALQEREGIVYAGYREDQI